MQVFGVDQDALAIAAVDAVARVVAGDLETAMEVLAGYLLDNLFRRLPASELWHALRSPHGITPREGTDVAAHPRRCRQRGCEPRWDWSPDG